MFMMGRSAGSKLKIFCADAFQADNNSQFHQWVISLWYKPLVQLLSTIEGICSFLLSCINRTEPFWLFTHTVLCACLFIQSPPMLPLSCGCQRLTAPRRTSTGSPWTQTLSRESSKSTEWVWLYFSNVNRLQRWSKNRLWFSVSDFSC